VPGLHVVEMKNNLIAILTLGLVGFLASCGQATGDKKYGIEEATPQREFVLSLCKRLDETPVIEIDSVRSSVVEYEEKGQKVTKRGLGILGVVEFPYKGGSESLEIDFSHHLEEEKWTYQGVSFAGEETIKKEIDQETLLALTNKLNELYGESRLGSSKPNDYNQSE